MLANRALLFLRRQQLEVEFVKAWNDPVLSHISLLHEVGLEHFEVLSELHVADLTELDLKEAENLVCDSLAVLLEQGGPDLLLVQAEVAHLLIQILFGFFCGTCSALSQWIA